MKCACGHEKVNHRIATDGSYVECHTRLKDSYGAGDKWCPCGRYRDPLPPKGVTK